MARHYEPRFLQGFRFDALLGSGEVVGFSRISFWRHVVLWKGVREGMSSDLASMMKQVAPQAEGSLTIRVFRFRQNSLQDRSYIVDFKRWRWRPPSLDAMLSIIPLESVILFDPVIEERMGVLGPPVMAL